MQLSFVEIWSHMGIPALVIAATLLLMGLASLTVFIERALALRESRSASERFAAAIASGIRREEIDLVIARCRQPEFEKAALAALVGHVLTAYGRNLNRAEVSGLNVVEQTRRHVKRFLEILHADLQKGLRVLSAVASTAPFIGLLGTVVGIISAFQGIASTGSGGLSSVSAGISEALIETALGLAVAIPVVLAFNYLSGQIAREGRFLDHAAGELLDTIEGWETLAPAHFETRSSPAVITTGQIEGSA